MTATDQRLYEIITTAYENSPEVRGRFEAAGLMAADVQTVADLHRIPVLEKDDVIALQQNDPPFGGLLAVPMSEIKHIFFSPGPLYEPEADDDHTPFDMARLVFEMCGFGPGDVVLNSLSYHLVPAGLLVDRSLAKLGCAVIPGGVGNSDLQLKMMADLGVTGYAGTPSFLMQLIKKAEAAGLDFKRDFKLTKIVTTAEPLPPSLRQTFVETYGLTVGNCYATAELGLLALDTEGQMAMRLLPQPIIQLVDPDTGQDVGAGEVGEVVVTNFSRAYPLIRFGTGDMAVNVDPNPGQSKQQERSVILVGRRGEAVKVRGMFVHPNQLRFATRPFPAVKGVQGTVSRQENRDFLTIRLAVDQDADRQGLIEPLNESIRATCRVRVDEITFVSPDELPADAPGMIDERDWT
ncbi:MAG TPA: AMP-binding protein [Anaerolineae bacterium]|jgi:phenylacetate-CoA ligase|nr:AMP-binding protein [Anaerolineae bacterium]